MTDYFFLELLEQNPVVLNKCNTPEFKHAKGIAWRSLLLSLKQRGQVFTESQLRRKWVNLKARALEKNRKRGGPESGLLSKNDTKVLELLGICGKSKTEFVDDDISCTKSEIDSGAEESKTSLLFEEKRDTVLNVQNRVSSLENGAETISENIELDSIEPFEEENVLSHSFKESIIEQNIFQSNSAANSDSPSSPHSIFRQPAVDKILVAQPKNLLWPKLRQGNTKKEPANNTGKSRFYSRKQPATISRDTGSLFEQEHLEIKRRRLALDEEKLRTEQKVLEELREIRFALGRRELSPVYPRPLSDQMSVNELSPLDRLIQYPGNPEAHERPHENQFASTTREYDHYNHSTSLYDAEGYLHDSHLENPRSPEIPIKIEPTVDQDPPMITTRAETIIKDNHASSLEPPRKRKKFVQANAANSEVSLNNSQHVIRLRTTCFGALTDLTNHVGKVSSLSLLDSVLETVEELTNLCSENIRSSPQNSMVIPPSETTADIPLRPQSDSLHTSSLITTDQLKDSQAIGSTNPKLVCSSKISVPAKVNMEAVLSTTHENENVFKDVSKSTEISSALGAPVSEITCREEFPSSVPEPTNATEIEKSPVNVDTSVNLTDEDALLSTSSSVNVSGKEVKFPTASLEQQSVRVLSPNTASGKQTTLSFVNTSG